MFRYLGSEVLAGSTAGSTYTVTLPTSLGMVQLMEVQPQGGAAFVTFDGTAPSSVNGVILSTGFGPYTYSHTAMGAARIVFHSTDAQAYINYYE